MPLARTATLEPEGLHVLKATGRRSLTRVRQDRVSGSLDHYSEEPMKTRLVISLLGLAISFALPIFAQQTNKPDPQLIQKLDTLNKKYPEAINNHDAAALSAMFTDDAIFVTHTGPVYGPKAIEKWYEDGFKASQP